MSQPIERVPSYGTDENATYDALLQRVQNIGQNRAVTSQQQRNGSDVSRELEKRADELNLSPEAQAQLRKLQQRDREVRAHESAHLSAAGQHAVGGAQYQYQKGPDGRMYAIGGHVSIDTSSVPGDPEETERKAEQVRRAALAPGEPSAQDSQIAAQAARMSAEARTEQRTNPEEEDGQKRQSPELIAGVPESVDLVQNRLNVLGLCDGDGIGVHSGVIELDLVHFLRGDAEHADRPAAPAENPDSQSQDSRRQQSQISLSA